MQIWIKRGSPEEIAEFFRKNRWIIARLLGDIVADDVVDHSPAADEAPSDAAAAIEQELENTLEEIEDVIDEMLADPSTDEEIQDIVDDIKETIDDIQEDMGYEDPDDQEDDLTLINGLGPKTAEGLKAAGIHTFKQVAALTDDEIAELDETIRNFAATFERKDYRGQAKELS